MKTCERCGEESVVSLMSMFNTEVICMDCIIREREHPDYEKAREAERAACMQGDRNFPGIGKPEDL